MDTDYKITRTTCIHTHTCIYIYNLCISPCNTFGNGRPTTISPEWTAVVIEIYRTVRYGVFFFFLLIVPPKRTSPTINSTHIQYRRHVGTVLTIYAVIYCNSYNTSSVLFLCNPYCSDVWMRMIIILCEHLLVIVSCAFRRCVYDFIWQTHLR